jgi:ferredoxin
MTWRAPFPGAAEDEETHMRISVDETRCCSSGQCAALAPGVFDQRDDDGVVILLDAAPPEAAHDAVREAALTCPAAAILFDP